MSHTYRGLPTAMTRGYRQRQEYGNIMGTSWEFHVEGYGSQFDPSGYSSGPNLVTMPSERNSKKRNLTVLLGQLSRDPRWLRVKIRWPIEIDGLPSYKMVIFHGELLNNQMVQINVGYPLAI